MGSSETYWRNPVTYGFTELPNLANHGGMVTLAGDLGTAANYLREEGVDGWTALMNEGHEDMRGDLDGLNVSMLVNRHGWPGETPVASTLSSYTLDLRGIGLGYQLLDYLPSDVAKVAVGMSGALPEGLTLRSVPWTKAARWYPTLCLAPTVGKGDRLRPSTRVAR